MSTVKQWVTAVRAERDMRDPVPPPRRGRPQIISTAEMVRAIKSSRSLRQAADKLGVWHGAITQRTEPEIVAARESLRSSLPARRREAARRARLRETR